MKRRHFLATTGVLALALAAGTAAWAENAKLKIGFVGVTSGPAAAWGISNQRSMETRAAWLNELGGVKIGDTTYDIEIVPFDDQKDPKRAIAGMEKMAQDGIHYVVGPNVDDGAAAVRPVAEQNGIMYFPYAFPKELYTPPASNAILGMVANYQSGPAIYKYLMENKGVKKVAFIAGNESDPLSQRDSGSAAAKVDVGIVTGANSFFLVTDEVVRQNGLEQWAHPCSGAVTIAPASSMIPNSTPEMRQPGSRRTSCGLISQWKSAPRAAPTSPLANAKTFTNGISAASAARGTLSPRYMRLMSECSSAATTRLA